MVGHEHGHAEPYKVPHPSIYKIDHLPELKQVQDALARQGLTDPWLRNEAWRFETKQLGTHLSRCRTFFLRGLGWGFGAFLVTIGAEYAFSKGGDDHDDHH